MDILHKSAVGEKKKIVIPPTGGWEEFAIIAENLQDFNRHVMFFLHARASRLQEADASEKYFPTVWSSSPMSQEVTRIISKSQNKKKSFPIIVQA